MQWRVGLLVLILLLAMPLCAAELYVAPRGDDANRGTRDAPLRTLAAARDAVRASVGKEAVTVNVADGVYYLADTLVLTPEDSGAKDAPVTYRAENEGKAVLSGGIRLKLDWIPYRDGILQAVTPAGMKFDQLFVDGVRKPMARYPNYDASKTTAAYQGFAADAFSDERAARWADPTGGYIHAMHRSRWGGYHYRITGKDRNGKVQYEGGWQNNRRMGMHEDFRMVENIFEELDAPGEWFHDAEGGLLYYMPAPGDDLGNAQVEVVRLGRIVEVQGSAATPVRHITLQGFVIRHAARTFMKTNEPLLRSDWAIHRGGAYLVIGGEDINVLDTEFDQVGGNAIFFSGYNRRIRVKGCHIHDVGASGVCFVGDPDAVRDPLFEYRQKNDLSTIDRTPGPKSDNYPSQGLVEDCLIHGIGRVERQPAGVQIAMAMEITVRDTSIYDCARAGINIGDGCWGGHLIERCDVFDTVLETHDHGSFNSWGRDRYWHSDRSVSQVAVDAEPNLPLLDAVETTVIRDSRWRCDHGWDIDLDDGSSNYDIYNNLMLNGGLKLREGFCRRAWNNFTVNNGFHPHVWYNHSRDEVFSNIFMAAHRGARMPSEVAKGKRIDSNLFFVTDPSIKDRFTQFGWDVNSVAADPQFVDPANGDFRVSEHSPALEIGFRNFPMTQFGVKKPALRAIARTPVIPDLEPGSGKSGRRTSDATSAPAVFFWLGARLQDLKGEEYSAFGTRKEDGGVVLAELPPNSAAALQGMIENDLVQVVNGRRVTSIQQLLGVAAELGRVPLMVQLVRNQQSMSVEVIPSLEVRVIGSANADDMTLPQDASIRVRAISANLQTANQPLGALIDGHLSDNFGPVFPNSVVGGAYKLNLGELKRVGAIRTCSFNKGGNRGAQKLTLYGSRSQKDPGWDLSNRNRFTPIGSVDTTGDAPTTFVSSVVAAPPAHALGEFRWIVWRVSPVTVAGENTAFQEFSVEVAE